MLWSLLLQSRKKILINIKSLRLLIKVSEGTLSIVHEFYLEWIRIENTLRLEPTIITYFSDSGSSVTNTPLSDVPWVVNVLINTWLGRCGETNLGYISWDYSHLFWSPVPLSPVVLESHPLAVCNHTWSSKDNSVRVPGDMVCIGSQTVNGTLHPKRCIDQSL